MIKELNPFMKKRDLTPPKRLRVRKHSMETSQQLLLTWSSPAFVILFCVGVWFVAGFVPPHLPAASAGDIAAFYQDSPNRIRTGLLITMFAATIWIPWAAALSAQMKRTGNHALANTQLGCGIATSIFVILPVLVWLAAAYRPERSAELLLFFNDFAFLMFVGLVPPAFFQITCVGLAILYDDRDKPVFPRWVGYYNIWTALLTLTGGLVFYFKDGPFAWNGWLAFWLPMCVYGIWYPAMFFILRKAIKAEAAGGTSAEHAVLRRAPDHQESHKLTVNSTEAVR